MARAPVYIPQTLDELMKYSEYISKSSVIPFALQKNPYNVMIVIQQGLALGLPPIQAIDSISIIAGKRTLYGDSYLGIAKSSGELEQYDEEIVGDFTKDNLLSSYAKVTAKRKGMKEVISIFTMEDAERAGLWSQKGGSKNSIWDKYPKRMLMMRARQFVLRQLFPDLFSGLEFSYEEIVEFDSTSDNEKNRGEQLLIEQAEKAAAEVAEAEIKVMEKILLKIEECDSKQKLKDLGQELNAIEEFKQYFASDSPTLKTVREKWKEKLEYYTAIEAKNAKSDSSTLKTVREKWKGKLEHYTAIEAKNTK